LLFSNAGASTFLFEPEGSSELEWPADSCDAAGFVLFIVMAI
jgi:hypothetical protein